jgi:protein Tex
VSQLADRFVSDAREVVKAGDIVKVRVVEVDVPRKRIALTMKLQQRPMNNTNTHNRSTAPAANNARNQSNANSSISSTSAMAEAFAKLKR